MTTRQLLRFKSRNLTVDLQELYENEISDSIAKSLEIWKTQTSLWWRTKFKRTRHVGNGLQMFVSGQVKGLYLVYKKITTSSAQSGFRRKHFRWNYDEFQGSQCTFSHQNFGKPFLLRHFRTMQVLFTPPLWITWSYQWKKTWRLWTFKHLLVIKMTKHRIFRPKGSLSSLFIWFADIFPRISGFTMCTEGR